ncbi:MAG: carotenoid 1,2-hydratase [Sphingobacteriia bacterium]|nr:carotenoid 1,2-hydratase [Sphingobacteriia bacterium]NCC40138.1 carotenoid 1,2-hydratase [Gammaproteobacteria bacterium]
MRPQPPKTLFGQTWIRSLSGLALALILAIPGPARVEDGFAPVTPGRALVFPEDTGAHPDYRTEWWYITGWLTDETGQAHGFQITFFRIGTGIGADNPSRFAPRQLILAHAAIADPRRGRLLHAERAARAVAPLAGAMPGRTRAWIGDWELVLTDEQGGDRYRAWIDAPGIGLDLVLVAPQAPVLNGREGFSQKTPDPLNASHYYSRPQLAVSGQMRIDEQVRPVSGHAWLDHEWSSEIMPPEAQGWDWIGINLHDGGSLMAFQMRRADGRALWTSATLGRGGETPRALAPDQVRFTAGRQWQSPRTGARYPVEWTLAIDGRTLRLVPLMDDQELDGRRSTGVVYWEGAVKVHEGDHEIGRGYLEMTGYWRRPEGL